MRTYVAFGSILLALALPTPAWAEGPITTKNYIERLDADRVLTKSGVKVEDFRCGTYKEKPKPSEVGRTLCFANLKFSPTHGIGVILITEQHTDTLVYAVAMSASSVVMAEDTKQAYQMALNLILVQQVMMAAFSPGYTTPKHASVAAQLTKGRMNKINDIQLGRWVYSMGDGLMTVFTVQRVDDRIVSSG
jgi:hypothetical protein